MGLQYQVCKQALQEEGKLDVFFANVRRLVFVSMLLSDLLLDNIHMIGRYCIQRTVGKYNRRNFHEYHACQCIVVRSWSLIPLKKVIYDVPELYQRISSHPTCIDCDEGH